MTYEELLIETENEGLNVKEKPLKYNDGRIKGNRVAIRKDLSDSIEKGCTLAEELGHHYTSYGNILDLQSISNRKQELRARIWAYDKLINFEGFINAFEHHCTNLYETATFLGVTEQFLADTINAYMHKYGCYIKYKNYVIEFGSNSVNVIKNFSEVIK